MVFLVVLQACSAVSRADLSPVAESRKHSIFPTNHIRIYQIFLLLARRDNQIWVLNLTIFLSKNKKKVKDSVGQLSKRDVLDSLRLLSKMV